MVGAKKRLAVLGAAAVLSAAGPGLRAAGGPDSLESLRAEKAALLTLQNQTLPRDLAALQRAMSGGGGASAEAAQHNVFSDLNSIRMARQTIAQLERRRGSRRVLRRPSKILALQDDIQARWDEIGTLQNLVSKPGLGEFALNKIQIDRNAIQAERLYLSHLAALSKVQDLRRLIRAQKRDVRSLRRRGGRAWEREIRRKLDAVRGEERSLAKLERGLDPSVASADGRAAAADAVRYLGTPSPDMVQDVFVDIGIDLPETPQKQSRVGAAVPGLSSALPGDLVFFPGPGGTRAAPRLAGIYIGKGRMIDVPGPGRSVQEDPVGQPSSIRRVVAPVAKAAL